MSRPWQARGPVSAAEGLSQAGLLDAEPLDGFSRAL